MPRQCLSTKLLDKKKPAEKKKKKKKRVTNPYGFFYCFCECVYV